MRDCARLCATVRCFVVDLLLWVCRADPENKQPAYADDPTVPHNSKAATFCLTVIYINNPRWEGVPFVLKCGKAVDSVRLYLSSRLRCGTFSFLFLYFYAEKSRSTRAIQAFPRYLAPPSPLPHTHTYTHTYIDSCMHT